MICLHPLRLEILRALTEDGRNIQYMEGSIGPFLAQWMPEVVTFGRLVGRIIMW